MPLITREEVEAHIKALQDLYTADQERVRELEGGLREARGDCDRRKKELTAWGTILASLRELERI